MAIDIGAQIRALFTITFKRQLRSWLTNIAVIAFPFIIFFLVWLVNKVLEDDLTFITGDNLNPAATYIGPDDSSGIYGTLDWCAENGVYDYGMSCIPQSFFVTGMNTDMNSELDLLDGSASSFYPGLIYKSFDSVSEMDEAAYQTFVSFVGVMMNPTVFYQSGQSDMPVGGVVINSDISSEPLQYTPYVDIVFIGDGQAPINQLVVQYLIHDVYWKAQGFTNQVTDFGIRTVPSKGSETAYNLLSMLEGYLIIFVAQLLYPHITSILVLDKEKGTRQLMKLSGLGDGVYVFVNFVFFIILGFLQVGVLFGCGWIFDITMFTSHSLAGILLPLCLWPFCMMCLCYFTSIFFKTERSTVLLLWIIVFVMAEVSNLANFVITLNEDSFNFFEIFPPVAFSVAINQNFDLTEKGDDMSKLGSTYWTAVILMFGECLILAIITFIFDGNLEKILNKLCCCRKSIDDYEVKIAKEEEEKDGKNEKQWKKRVSIDSKGRRRSRAEEMARAHFDVENRSKFISDEEEFALKVTAAVKSRDSSFSSSPDIPDESAEGSDIQRGCDGILVDGMDIVYYPFMNDPVHAVKKVSLCVKSGECVALCGSNGAGKTTLHEAILGEVPISDGFVSILGYDQTSVSGARSTRGFVGVCAQFNGLWERVTGIEHIMFYAMIRGMGKEEARKQAQELIDAMGLTAFGNKQSKTYSGGMARRLNIGLSLAGNPAFLLLDECSTGLDPESRRTLWTLIEDVKKRTVTLPDGRVVNPTILLNTHSLEEAEALADRICIMDEGIIKALGTAQEIKSEHGTGYRVTVIAAGDSDEQMDEAEEVVEKAVKRKIMLVDQMFTTMIYAAPSKGVSLGSVASSLEQAQKRGKIDDWTVSTVSLEEIFLSLAEIAK
eukprot:gnl/Carplike_NY0171/2460_a3308_592.p1 GENE.gnl/Carplike_NY0171/2460_a3308_592~~gnl/Carplike_NY0171/2460_a3308_592.p1  ORF type:complete len:898 (+),score=289.26 gnl/Carplike_NY0171/2460_a3308_592:31-2694(+)